MGIFGNTFGLPHLILILVIILLLFGAPKLPGLARSLGQSMKIFRAEIKDPNKVDDDAAASSAADTDVAGDQPAKKNKSS
jgi:sec-independent protein translocase protein TatA